MNKKEIKKYLNEEIAKLLENKGMELVEIVLTTKELTTITIYIYKESGVTLDDCTEVSREIDAILNLDTLFDDKYMLEVSSPGIDRKLKTLDDYRRNLGKMMEIKLYKAKDGIKTFYGFLDSYDDTHIYIKEEENIIEFTRDEVSVLREYIDFGGKRWIKIFC